MKKNTSAGIAFAKQKTLSIIALAIVAVLLMTAGLLLSTWNTSASAETLNIASDNWYVAESEATKNTAGSDELLSITLKGASVITTFPVSITPSAENKYWAVKYSGTASIANAVIYCTQSDGTSVAGWTTGNVAADGDWLVPVKLIGSDYSVVVIDIQSAYSPTNTTNLGFIINGSEGDTFIVYGMELLSDTNHSFGTPQPVEKPPVERGEMEVCDMVNDNNGAYTISKADDGVQTVSREKYWGTAVTIVNVKFWDSTKKYLIIDFETNGVLEFGVGTGASWANLTSGNQNYAAGAHEKLVFDMSLVAFDDVDANIYFLYDSGKAWGTDLENGAATTITFNSISFSETDPRASEEDNHFRTPEGKAGVVYSESDGKITYTNTRTDYYRYLEIILDNHTPATHDVLSIKLTGYNGLVMGVRVLYNDEVEGDIAAATKDVIASSAYYSEIKTDALTDIVIYLAADNLKGKEVTGVQLYLDAPAAAGKDGDVEITLESIEMLSSAELDPADVTITASDDTVTYGGTAPNFNAALKANDSAIDGTIITEYRSFGATGNYTAGLPTNAGEYEIRFYYMGSREYNYSRSKTVKLTINKAAADPDTADNGISFDAATRVVTVNTGYEASTSETFAAGNEVTNGYVIPHGETKKIYYRVVADENHLAGTIKNKEFTAPEAPAVTVVSIAVTAQPTKTTYTVGDTLDITGLVVTATYSDETTAPVTVTSAMLSGHNMSAAGTYTVTVTYEGKTATFGITVNAASAKTLSSIAVTTNPTKTAYNVGDTIDLAGLKLTATYSDGTTADITVTTAMLSGYDMTTAGTKTVTITHEGKTATFKITVKAVENGGNTEPAKDGLGTTAIVLIVLAAVVCAGGAAAAVVIVLRKKKGANK